MNKEELIDIYYDNSFLTPYFKQFKKYLGDEPKVVELNCGYGENLSKMHELGATCLGIDTDESVIDEAKQRNPGITFLVNDLTLDIKSIDIFKGVILNDVYSKVDLMSLGLIFNNVYGSLDKEGYLFIISKNEYSKEAIETIMNKKFIFVEELIGNEKISFYIYKKVELDPHFLL